MHVWNKTSLDCCTIIPHTTLSRYAGLGQPPSALAAGALVFSVPRLSTFILPDEVVRDQTEAYRGTFTRGLSNYAFRQ